MKLFWWLIKIHDGPSLRNLKSTLCLHIPGHVLRRGASFLKSWKNSAVSGNRAA